ncbi:MAG: hypothetical protein NHB15_02275 [Methanosarcina barkeri]|nr:hypothetical protein [Methanosarcina sp. ERenArc_MAG2]
MSVKREPLQSNDLITKEEINKMIAAASTLEIKQLLLPLPSLVVVLENWLRVKLRVSNLFQMGDTSSRFLMRKQE